MVKYKFARRKVRTASKPKVSEAVKTYVKQATKQVADSRYAYRQSTSAAGGGDTMTNTITYFEAMKIPTPGDEFFNREGDSISPTFFRFWGHVLGFDTYNITRFVLFQFLGDTTTASPQAASMWDNSIAGSGQVNCPYTPLKHEGKNLYNILYDSGPRKTTLASLSYFNDNGLYLFDIKIPKRNLRKIRFTQQGANTGTGIIYCCVMSDSSVAGHPLIQWHSELKYIA